VEQAARRIALLPLAEQPAAWGALDEQIQTDYFPIVAAFYQSQAMLHGSRIGGMNNDSLSAAPTWKDLYVLP
jgi:peptide/nickel transport system substrate-binding protein